MAELVICEKQDFVDIADIIRQKSGKTGMMSLAMLKQIGAGITVSGINTLDATATSADVVTGKTAYVKGVKITGTHECSGGDNADTSVVLQSKTVNPSESAQTISFDSGYSGLSSVTVNAISSTYIGSGITKKSAQTYTPTTQNQTIASGQYLNGTQTIKGDTNLIAGNIKSGVTIFGVTGTLETSGGGTSGAQSGNIVKAWQSSNLTVASGYTAVSVSYGTEVVNTNGTLSLGGTTGSVSVSSVDSLADVKGKYINISSNIYWIPTDATFTQGGTTWSKTYTVDKANQMFVLA